MVCTTSWTRSRRNGLVVHARGVLGDGVVEGELLLREAELLRALRRRVHLLLHLEHLRDDRRRVDEAVVVPLQRLLEQFPERLRLGEVSRLPPPDLVRQQLLEQLEPQVLLRLVLEGLEELVVEDRDVGALDAGRLEDVHHALGLDVVVHQVAHGLFDRALLACGRAASFGSACAPAGRRSPRRRAAGSRRGA